MRILIENLFEMAYSRRQAIEELRRYNKKRIDHLLFVYFFPDNESVNHWLNEICSWSNESPRVKPKNKLLDYKTIKKVIWLEPKDNVDSRSIRIKLKNFTSTKNMGIPKDYDVENVLAYLENFHNWLANQLSMYSELDNEDIKQQIMKLVKKCNSINLNKC